MNNCWLPRQVVAVLLPDGWHEDVKGLQIDNQVMYGKDPGKEMAHFKYNVQFTEPTGLQINCPFEHIHAVRVDLKK